MLSLGNRGAVALSCGQADRSDSAAGGCPLSHRRRAMRSPPRSCGRWRIEGPFADSVRWGVAAGTASAMLPGMKFASLEETRKIYDEVEVA